MLCVSLRNLLVRAALKVAPLELAMSSFWFVFSGWSSLSVPRLVIFHWDQKSNEETKRVYLLVINKSVKVVIRCIIYMRVISKRIVVSRVEVQIQVITQCRCVAFEVI